jgi:RNA polymerase sigma factor (sigma-70 family)
MATKQQPVPSPRAGDVASVGPRAFDEFFHDEHGGLFAALCLVTGSRHEADELAQEAFVRLLERWDRVSEMDDPKGYLFRTAMNLFRKRCRRAEVRARLPVQQRRRDDAFAVIDDRDELVRALLELSPRQRAAVVLTTIVDLPSQEVGRMLGISDSTVRVLAAKAKASMRPIVEEGASP